MTTGLAPTCAGVIESIIVERDITLHFDDSRMTLLPAHYCRVSWVGLDGRSSSQGTMSYGKPAVMRVPITYRDDADQQHTLATVHVEGGKATLEVGGSCYPLPIRDGLRFWTERGTPYLDALPAPAPVRVNWRTNG